MYVSRTNGRAHLHVDLPRERRAAPPIELPGIEVGPIRATSSECQQVVCCNEQNWTIPPIQ
jgi:hypothetical protein